MGLSFAAQHITRMHGGKLVTMSSMNTVKKWTMPSGQ